MIHYCVLALAVLACLFSFLTLVMAIGIAGTVTKLVERDQQDQEPNLTADVKETDDIQLPYSPAPQNMGVASRDLLIVHNEPRSIR